MRLRGAFTNCKGDDDVDAKRSRPSIGKPAKCHARKERVLLVGTDQRITSGPAATTAAFRGRIHGCTRTIRKNVRFFSCTAGAVHTWHFSGEKISLDLGLLIGVKRTAILRRGNACN